MIVRVCGWPGRVHGTALATQTKGFFRPESSATAASRERDAATKGGDHTKGETGTYKDYAKETTNLGNTLRGLLRSPVGLLADRIEIF